VVHFWHWCICGSVTLIMVARGSGKRQSFNKNCEYIDKFPLPHFFVNASLGQVMACWFQCRCRISSVQQKTPSTPRRTREYRMMASSSRSPDTHSVYIRNPADDQSSMETLEFNETSFLYHTCFRFISLNVDRAGDAQNLAEKSRRMRPSSQPRSLESLRE
jgi:hypothetical protein